MALSDDVKKLADRAKDAEDRTAEAREKAKAELEADRDAARVAGEEQGKELRAVAEKGEEQISDAWKEMQISWNNATAALRENIQNRKAEHDLHQAQRSADLAEDDAKFAIDFAYSAIGEAEYAVLDATLARKEAEELSQQAGATP
jgi:hypothetical protein